MNSRADYLIRRAIFAVVTIFVAITLNFIIFRLGPGNFTDTIRSPHFSADTKRALESEFGLDKSKWEQYVDYLKQLTHFNMGISFADNQPVWPQLWGALRRTGMMIMLGTLISILIGIVTGVFAAWRRGTKSSHGITISALAFYAVPTQWLGMMIIFYLAVPLHLPTNGITNDFASLTGFAYAKDAFVHMLLPALTLVLTLFGEYTLIVRSSMLETMGEDYVLTAKAKGLSTATIIRRYALRNAMLPTVALIALSLGFVVAGAILIETVFTYPGIGFIVYDSVQNSDWPMLQGAFLLLTVSVVTFNFIADLVYFKLDPRITQ